MTLPLATRTPPSGSTRRSCANPPGSGAALKSAAACCRRRRSASRCGRTTCRTSCSRRRQVHPEDALTSSAAIHSVGLVCPGSELQDRLPAPGLADVGDAGARRTRSRADCSCSRCRQRPASSPSVVVLLDGVAGGARSRRCTTRVTYRLPLASKRHAFASARTPWPRRTRGACRRASHHCTGPGSSDTKTSPGWNVSKGSCRPR